MPPPSGIKLRDSCETCAASKVRCSKDKPACVRCTQRAIPCRYLVTQRTGRKSLSQNSTAPLLASIPTTTTLPTPELEVNNNCTEELASSFMPLGATLDDFIESLSRVPSESVPETYGQQFSGLELSISNKSNIASPNYQGEIAAFAEDESLIGGFPTVAIEKSCHVSDEDCLRIALRILEQLSSGEYLRIANSSTASLDSLLNESLPPQACLNKIKQTINTVGDILRPVPCQNGYFLVITSMIVTRILGVYATIAQSDVSSNGSRSSSGSPSVLSHHSIAGSITEVNNNPDSGNIDPKTAQQVLNELHHMEELINQLSARIQEFTRNKRKFDHCPGTLDYDTMHGASPFSSSVLNGMDTELRERFSSLSLKLIERIREYWKLKVYMYTSMRVDRH